MTAEWMTTTGQAAVDHAVCGDMSRSNCTGPALGETFQVVARARMVA